MFTEQAVLASVAPICSAIDMKRLLNTSSSSGERCAGSSEDAVAGELRRRSSSPPASTSATQPGSTTVVLVASQTIAGPGTKPPGRRASRSYTGVSCQEPPVYMGTRSRAAGSAAASPVRPGAPGSTAPAAPSTVAGSIVPAPGPTASTATASRVRGRSGIRKP